MFTVKKKTPIQRHTQRLRKLANQARKESPEKLARKLYHFRIKYTPEQIECAVDFQKLVLFHREQLSKKLPPDCSAAMTDNCITYLDENQNLIYHYFESSAQMKRHTELLAEEGVTASRVLWGV